jgi:hypothetical protein
MNPTSQNTGHRFPFSSGHTVMNGRTLYVALFTATALGFLLILLEYKVVQGHNPFNRMGYAVFMSVVPALGALLVLKLTNFFVSWRGAAIVYIALFVLVLIIHGVVQNP